MPSLFQSTLCHSPQAAKKSSSQLDDFYRIDLKGIETQSQEYDEGRDEENKQGVAFAPRILYCWIPVFLITFLAIFIMYMVTSFLFVQYCLEDFGPESERQSLDELLILGEIEEPEFVTMSEIIKISSIASNMGGMGDERILRGPPGWTMNETEEFIFQNEPIRGHSDLAATVNSMGH